MKSHISQAFLTTLIPIVQIAWAAIDVRNAQESPVSWDDSWLLFRSIGIAVLFMLISPFGDEYRWLPATKAMWAFAGFEGCVFIAKHAWIGLAFASM